MSYYMGDFYRGDPGIGSFFRGLAKRVAGSIPVVGPAISGIIDVLPGGAKVVRPALPAAAGVTGAAAGGAITRGVEAVKGAIIKHPVVTAAAGAGAIGSMAGVGATMMMHRAAGGHVLPKCHQPLKSGRLGKCHRSMNVCNPRALRRAIRRTRGFAKLAMKTIHIVHPKKKGRFGGFKKRRRS